MDVSDDSLITIAFRWQDSAAAFANITAFVKDVNPGVVRCCCCCCCGGGPAGRGADRGAGRKNPAAACAHSASHPAAVGVCCMCRSNLP